MEVRSESESQVETRRQRLRRELTDDIVRIAREQLVSSGPGAVTWRGIAREVGMNPASLYTYFDSLDALYTRLILESSSALAGAVQAAFDDAEGRDPIERAMACAHALRAWAVERPAEYNLVFTDQIPGYEAPADSGTFESEMAILRPLVRSVGEIVGRDDDPATPPEDPADADEALRLLAILHGLVGLEINHHLPRGGEEDRFDRIMRSSLGDLVEAHG